MIENGLKRLIKISPNGKNLNKYIGWLTTFKGLRLKLLRDYNKLVDRIEQIGLPYNIIGTVNTYPIYKLDIKSSSAKPKNILITGGLHGDEPAGVEAVLQFLERDNTNIQQLFSFTVIPCINPYGYVYNIRENQDAIDINRSFETDDVQEVRIVKKTIDNIKYSFTIDFHEDYEAQGFYLYEGKRDEQYIGPEIANKVITIGPIDSDDSGEDTTEIVQGVYKVASKWGTQGLAPYLLHFHSEHVLITETPTVWSLQQRAYLHLGVLDAALEHYSMVI